jgi:hypothetical protein
MKKWPSIGVFEKEQLIASGKLKPLQKKWQAGKAESKALEKSC